MKIKQLIAGLSGLDIKGSKEVVISGLSIDSRIVSPGHLFIAQKGSSHDGNIFIEKAIQAGAVAIVTDLYDPFIPKTQIICSNPSSLTPVLASHFYKKPSEKLFVFGATGTKGKTTTTYLAKQLLDEIGYFSGLMSTVETMAGQHRFFSTLTTHDAIFNQKWLREMVSVGSKAACLEVSSHGLSQHRVDEIAFDAALFTNLTPDHLDYHHTIEAYSQSKKRFFTLLDQSPKKQKRAFFNADSPWTARMREGVQTPSWTFGIDRPADLLAKNCRYSWQGTDFMLQFQGQDFNFHTQLIGKFNVYNVLGAIAVALHLGYSLQELEAPVARLIGAPGRLQRVSEQAFVDFAHTGESLTHVLSTLKELTQKRLWVVFGCGGDRDPNRRKEMAKAAESYADRIIVTSDNPRSEDPEEICRQILQGFEKPQSVFIELDRKKAIEHAAHLLEPADLLLIAGKGHEKVQIFAHKTVPFDDVEILREALATMKR